MPPLRLSVPVFSHPPPFQILNNSSSFDKTLYGRSIIIPPNSQAS
jgi:hypothetical protein